MCNAHLFHCSASNDLVFHTQQSYLCEIATELLNLNPVSCLPLILEVKIQLRNKYSTYILQLNS